MPAGVTLATTTLAQTLDGQSSQIKLASTAGVVPGQCLYVDGELMNVLRLGVDPWVAVLRGVGGSKQVSHASGQVVYLGRADQFYDVDPVGRPNEVVLVSPWINVVNGNVFFAQGDNDPAGLADRWWQLQRTTYDQGPLGIRVKTLDPTAST